MRPANYYDMQQMGSHKHYRHPAPSPNYSHNYRQNPPMSPHYHHRPMTPMRVPTGDYYHQENIYRRDHRAHATPQRTPSDHTARSSHMTRNDQIRSLFLKRNIDLSASERLGAGKYSKVFTAVQLNPENPNEKHMIAMKIINTRKVTSEFSQKFLPREIDCWKRLQHPNLVRLLGHYTAFHYVFLTMEYAARGDMLGYVQKNGAVSEPQGKKWMTQIISGVEHMHSRGIAHRDLKLENVVLFSDGNVKVADFGFARSVDHSFSHTFCGSKSYSAPEILLGSAYNAFKSDVWSVGIVAFIMLTDRMPFSEDQRNHKIVELQKKRAYTYPSRIHIPAKVRYTIDSILNFYPDHRPSIRDCFQLPWFTSVGQQ